MLNHAEKTQIVFTYPNNWGIAPNLGKNFFIKKSLQIWVNFPYLEKFCCPNTFFCIISMTPYRCSQ